MSGSTGIRPLDKALSGLEQTINEWEQGAEKPVYISLKEPSLNDLYKEKGEVYKILRCWRSGYSGSQPFYQTYYRCSLPAVA